MQFNVIILHIIYMLNMNNNRNIINIKGNDQTFSYLIEYVNKHSNITFTDGSNVNWHSCKFAMNCIHLLDDSVKYYRHQNDWYNYDRPSVISNQYIPQNINTAKIRVYMPNHSISTYKRGAKYMLSINTYINGYKIDLGSFIFKTTDAIASKFGNIKYGNIEYSEYVEFEILDPYYIVYSDYWIDFRHNVCGEPKNINNTGSLVNVSLYSITECEDRYMIDPEYNGGITSFNISNPDEFLSLYISCDVNSDIKLTVKYNDEYDWLITYFKETYGITTKFGQAYDNNKNGLFFEVVIKDENDIFAVSDSIPYNANEENGKSTQIVYYESLINSKNSTIKSFFNSWENFYEGCSIVSSLVVYDNNEEVFSLISNELPITQELFSRFVNGGSKKIIDLTEMEIINYNVVNKIVNEVLQIERPNDSKSNIIQPVFFKVKETELLTLHPDVTENICINLDDYKSKVGRFILQIDNCRFEQIGANSYGILFKVLGNKISKEVSSGLYYILDENFELVTTGKFNCVR